MWKGVSKFKISGLNQEKVLNEISKQVPLSKIDRQSKNTTTFQCPYLEHKKAQKILKSRGIVVDSVSHHGLLYSASKVLSSYGLIASFLCFFVLYFFQNQFILQFEIQGLRSLPTSEVVHYIKDNFSQNKHKIDTAEVEIGLMDKFEQISFASCIVKGQTLVVNIKEKLLPDEMYGTFSPIISKKNGKITEINLISGTCNVKVGDYVRAGDVLVEPYAVDTSGNIVKVEARAEIFAEVYYEGAAQHCETIVETVRTGRVATQNVVTLFGLNIYTFKEQHSFAQYEVETEQVDLIKNLFLPFKLTKTKLYELEERVTNSKFDDVKEEYIAKAKEKALENCENYDKMIDEYYTIRHLSTVTVVNFCIVTLEDIA